MIYKVAFSRQRGVARFSCIRFAYRRKMLLSDRMYEVPRRGAEKEPLSDRMYKVPRRGAIFRALGPIRAVFVSWSLMKVTVGREGMFCARGRTTKLHTGKKAIFGEKLLCSVWCVRLFLIRRTEEVARLVNPFSPNAAKTDRK